ncbi:hypothetical protein ENSA5_07710 [Enhygromyxa salina]|uniref:Uncharacterized protein n=1 Tax=Enhygromyxa salina TaxID=215803 RepID=A0A2S9YH94_9BACT|nr:hypothetical protein ENSA5_07710 [Enhygromyxa salina]
MNGDHPRLDGVRSLRAAMKRALTHSAAMAGNQKIDVGLADSLNKVFVEEAVTRKPRAAVEHPEGGASLALCRNAAQQDGGERSVA